MRTRSTFVTSGTLAALAGVLPLLAVVVSTLIAVSAQPAVAAPTINVKTYGAKGDGTTDDQTAIQNAFNAASSSHATVFFPRGNYLHSANLSANGIGINGDRATLVATTSGTPSLLLSGKCNVSNLRFQLRLPRAGASPAIQVLPASDGSRISKVSVVPNFCQALFINGTNTVISECSFSTSKQDLPAYILGNNGSSNTLVSKCSFHGGGGSEEGAITGRSVTNLRVTGCTFTNLRYGVHFSPYFGNTVDTVQVDNNRFVSTVSGVRFTFDLDASNITITNNQILNGVPGAEPSVGIISEGRLVSTLIEGNRIVNFPNGGITFNREVELGNAQGVQIRRNTIENTGGDAISFLSGDRTDINTNTITNCNASAIRVSQTNTFLFVDRNKITNAGLTGAQAVVLIGENGGNGGLVSVSNNNYRGNSANLAFYIRSFPPATLTGNTTTTLLPSEAGF